jgi:SPP1 gp7 family putative phage head morphogenesis protein
MKRNDYGFKESEKLLNQLEAKIHKEYEQAAKEIGEKADAYFAQFKKEDDIMCLKYKNKEITKAEYQQWRIRKMQRGHYWSEMKRTLAEDLTNVDKIAMSYVNDKVIDVYALNMNYGTYLIEHETRINTSFSLYNRDAVKALIKDNPTLLPSPKVEISKDLKWNMQHIQSALTQGILQGESIPKIARRIQKVARMDNSSAIRTARTSMTGAQNRGRLDSMIRAIDKGIALKKVWIATLDNVTRDSHVDLDGEVVDVDKTFSNGLEYPADGAGEPAETYNCRCKLAYEYDKYKTDWSNLENRRHDKLGDMSYDEWKETHRKHAEEVARRKAEREKKKNG